MSDEIEKIESEGLSEEDKADIETESEASQQISEEDPAVTVVENIEDLSEAYSNVVVDVVKEDDDPDVAKVETDSAVADASNSEMEAAEEDAPVEEDIADAVQPIEDLEPSDNEEPPSDTVAETESEPAGEDDSEGDTEEDDEESSDSEPGEISTCSVIEAILFAADEPVNARKLVEIINAGGIKEVKKHIKELNRKYKKMDCAFRIEQLAGGYQLLTLSAYKPWLSKLIKVRSESKLTAAAMETLSIIAYKQPIMRVEIENIRGVAAGEMIRQLIEKGMVKIVGRAEELGRPLLYGTTQKFLDIFGLGSLKDLPQPEEQK